MIMTTYDPATHVLVPRELTNKMMTEGQIGYVRWNVLIAAAPEQSEGIPAAPAQMSDAEIVAEWESQCGSTLVSHPRETWVSKAGVLAFARALLAQGK